MEDTLTFLRRFQNITATLDAVIFSDGLAVGRDTGHAIPHCKALLDVYREEAELVQNSPDQEVREAMEEMVRVGLKFFDSPSERDLVAIGYSRLPYDESLIAVRGLFSVDNLENMKTRGDAAYLRELRDSTRSKVFPRVHRPGE
jgi:hypothetical protein